MIVFGYNISITKDVPKLPRGKHLKHRNTMERKLAREKFFNEYGYLIREILKTNTRSFDFKTLEGIRLVELARKKLGFSARTASMDIHHSIIVGYKKWKKNESEGKKLNWDVPLVIKNSPEAKCSPQKKVGLEQVKDSMDNSRGYATVNENHRSVYGC